MNRAYTADGLNRYAQATSGGGTTSFSYDANGNLAGDGTNGWTYDRESRLVASSAGPVLTYDPLGRLYQVTSGSNTTRFLWDGWTLIAEYDGSGAVTERYVHGDGTDNPIFWYHGSSVGSTNRRQLYADPLGSIVAVTDAAGNRTNVNSYDEYGIPASGNTGRFQYTGLPWLPELGMQYSRNRIYSPTMGRFMQTDPIGMAGGINLYGYVTNDPVNLIDPSGLNPDCDDLSVQWDNKVGCPLEDPEENVVVTGTRGGGWGASPYYTSGMGIGGGGGNESGVDRPQRDPCFGPNARARAQANALASRLGPVTFNTRSEMRLLEQYFRGDTTPYRLSAEEFAAAQSFVSRYPNAVSGISMDLGNGLTTRNIFFGSSVIADSRLDALLGTARGIFRGNDLVGIRDTFNFDFKGRGGYPGGWLANLGVLLVRLDAATCAGNISISVSGGQ